VKGYQAFLDGLVAMLTGVSAFAAYGNDTTAPTFCNTHLQPIPTLTAGEKITMCGDKSARIDGSTAIFSSLRVVIAVAASFMPC
jgi:hypothetical protein